MSLHLITGHASTEHVTSANAGMLNSMIFGPEKYIFNVGQQFDAEVRSNNLIRIYDGEGMINGRHFDMVSGTYEDMEISNGSQGLNRNDLIVARYEINEDTGVESIRLLVIEGEATSGEAQDPDIIEGSILDGNGLVDMPLYRISLRGLSVEGATQLFTVKNPINVEIKEIGTDVLVRAHEEGEPASAPKDADTLGGLPAADYALNSTLDEKQNKEYSKKSIGFLSGLQFTEGWTEADIECVFGLNEEYRFAFHVNSKMFENRATIKLVNGSYVSASDCHSVAIEVSKIGVVGIAWTWSGQNVSSSSKLEVYER